MSNVTRFILIVGCGHEEEIVRLNRKLGRDWFIPLKDEVTEGDKSIECDVCVTALNYCDEDEIIMAVLNNEWLDREQIQLLIKRQEEEQFSVVVCEGMDIKEKEVDGGML